jgi:hypothetical protein
MLAAHIAGSRHSLRPPLRMQFNTDNSLNSVGFLSPEMEPIIADLRKIHATWFVFAEDVNRTGQRILREFQPSGTMTVRDVVGIALLMRTLSNFQGTILMAQRGMAAEAGTLARCCFENAFFLGTLRKEEDDFLAEMQMADRYGVKAAARWLVRIPDRLEHAPRRAKQRLEGLINEIKQQIPGFEPPKFEALANRAGVADAYVHYATLSREAAHPSAQSLDRHFVRGRGATPLQEMRWGAYAGDRASRPHPSIGPRRPASESPRSRRQNRTPPPGCRPAGPLECRGRCAAPRRCRHEYRAGGYRARRRRTAA